MCRLFGLTAGRRPVAATFWLLDAPDSLAAQSHREPDGTGLGWFDERGAPHVEKRPVAAYGDAGFAREARRRRSATFVAHIRFATTGALTPANTHPFEQDGRLFAHNGVLGDLPRLEERLGERRRLVHGETDSERLFALVTAEIKAAGGDVEAGIAAAIGWIADELPVLSLNFVLVAPGRLWALRYPETDELFVLERDAGGHRGGEPLEHAATPGTIRVRADEPAECPVVVVATERMDDDPGWRPLRSGELLCVDEDLGLRSVTIRDAPPRHPMPAHS